METILTAVFVIVDDFCLNFRTIWEHGMLNSKSTKHHRPHQLCDSEIMTLLIVFHMSSFKNLKNFYQFIQKYHANLFHKMPTYQRFNAIQATVIIPLLGFFLAIRGSCTGKSFIDATSLSVCKNKRIFNHKVFSGLAARGKTTMGWFFGFKLHLVINDAAIPVSFTLTPGNIDDRAVVDSLLKNFWGTIIGDRGYISKDLFSKLFKKGIRLVTGLRKTMKPQLVTQEDTHNLNQRSVIESVFNSLKNVHTLEHSRHRSVKGFLLNIVACIACYTIRRYSLFGNYLSISS